MKKRIFWVPCNIAHDEMHCYEPIIGELIVISGWENMPLIISRGIENIQWEITHYETGTRIVHGRTQNDVILKLVKILSTKTKKEMNTTIDSARIRMQASLPNRPPERIVTNYVDKCNG